MNARPLLALLVMATIVVLSGCATTGSNGANNIDHCINPASLCYSYRSSG